MAATTVKPYPHVQINVKDNSIATINFVETLPVHRALYVMRTQKGPLGEPTWCNTYSEAAALFGAETFNPANKEYYTRASAFLKETMTRNGAFITRYLPGEAYDAVKNPGGYKAATLVYEVVLTPGQVKQYKHLTDEQGNPLNSYELEFNDDTQEWQKKENGTVDGIKVRYQTREATADELEQLKAGETLKPQKKGLGVVYPIAVFRAAYPGNYGNDIAIKLFYTSKSNNAGDTEVYDTVFYQIGFEDREYNSTTWNAITDVYGRDNMAFSANPDAINVDSGNPLSLDFVLDKGFSDATHQLPVNFDIFEKNINEAGLVIAAYETDYKNSEDDMYAGSLNSFDDTSSEIGYLKQTEKGLIKTAFESSGILSAQNWKDLEDAEEKDEINGVTYSPATYGYRVNILSLTNMGGEKYDRVEMEDVDVSASSNGVTYVIPGQSYRMPLTGGYDGEFVDPEGSVKSEPGTDNGWSSDDKAMYQFCKLKLSGAGDRIVESLRYPFTHIFDLGFSIKTKKAMCDFLDIRDDVVVILSSVVLYSDGSGSSLSFFNELDTPGDAQAKDEANTETLRSYALLMRESVLYGTDCMRCSIYNHAGTLANGSFNGIMPFTYWVAVQYAQYGNLTYMNQQEPRGLPNSYNLLFKKWSWNNYRADSQSRVWDAGANYVQYADMTRLFYPSLRTVYRAATSVLVDEWFVAAVVYTKYVCRRAWATFSGRNDSAAVLQGAIKTYLDKELKALYNGKYTFDVTVYQTAEEQQLGYIQHVKLSITAPATMRVLDVDIEVNRENFVPEE